MPEDTNAIADRIKRREVAALAEFLVTERPRLLAFIERQLGAALRTKIGTLFQAPPRMACRMQKLSVQARPSAGAPT